jgi:RIO-like serine/threonine protein kinase
MGFLVDSLMITEYLRHAVDLEAFLTVRLRDVDPQVQRRLKPRLADGLAAFVLQLQRAGFIHRDLKALNVIVQWDPESDESPRISLVDLDGLRQSAAAAARGHLRMLMRLNVSVDAFRRVSLADRARVLHRYLARAGRPRSEFKLLWRRLADMSERKREIRTRQQERAFKKYGRF